MNLPKLKQYVAILTLSIITVLPFDIRAQTPNAKTFFTYDLGVNTNLKRVSVNNDAVSSLKPLGLSSRLSFGRVFGKHLNHQIGLNWNVFQVHAAYPNVEAYSNNPDREMLPTMHLYYSQVLHAFSLDYGYRIRLGKFCITPSFGLGGAFALTPRTEVDYSYREWSERWADITENNTLTENYFREVIINLGLDVEYKLNEHIGIGFRSRLIASPWNISKNVILPVRTTIQINDRSYEFSPAMTLRNLQHSLGFRYTF